MRTSRERQQFYNIYPLPYYIFVEPKRLISVCCGRKWDWKCLKIVKAMDMCFIADALYYLLNYEIVCIPKNTFIFKMLNRREWKKSDIFLSPYVENAGNSCFTCVWMNVEHRNVVRINYFVVIFHEVELPNKVSSTMSL